MKQFKMAIMGSGNIAAQMAVAINGLKEVEAYAVCICKLWEEELMWPDL